MDLLVIVFGIVTMLIRSVSYWKNRNALERVLLDIAMMAKQTGICWKSQLKLGLLLVLAEISIFFTCDFLATILTVTSNIYWFFNYATIFIVGFTENYFHFELQSAIRRIFASINLRVREQMKNKSKEKSIRNVMRCAKEHYVMVRIAKRTNEVFGFVLASWFALNFFHLTGEINYCLVTSRKMMATGKFVPKVFTSGTWIVLLLTNLVFLIGSWQRTSDEVST